MIHLRPAAARGLADHGWLLARHSFSFADYYDPEEMGWGVLRVINEDRIRPGAGFGRHGHRDMEIVTWIIAGALEHQDSLGHGGILRPGEVQRMSAGRGILHSEANPSEAEETHLLQIWIEPAARGGPASYEQKPVPAAELAGRLRPVATPDGREGSTVIGQDACLYASRLAPGEALEYDLAPGRLAYLQVIRGCLELNGQVLVTGDGAKIADETRLRLAVPGPAAGGQIPGAALHGGAETTAEPTEFLLFDLPPRS